MVPVTDRTGFVDLTLPCVFGALLNGGWTAGMREEEGPITASLLLAIANDDAVHPLVAAVDYLPANLPA